MSEYTILEHCSPTLAGIKTGNIVSVPYHSKEEVLSDLARWNRELNLKGIRVIVLKYMKERVLLYIYRPGALMNDLTGPEASELLSECGYEGCGEDACICTLIRRLRENSEFPHEIGLFLGYPTEDVRGFMEHHGADYKYSGLWKVYGNVDECRRKFKAFRICTDVYCRAGRHGRTLSELAVAKKSRKCAQKRRGKESSCQK